MCAETFKKIVILGTTVGNIGIFVMVGEGGGGGGGLGAHFLTLLIKAIIRIPRSQKLYSDGILRA